MGESEHLLIFALDEQRYALRLTAVERVVPAVEITQLPKAPDIVLGVINMRGRVIPVMDTRRRFRLPERELYLSDQFIVARTALRPVALVVDSTSGVIKYPMEEVVRSEDVVRGMEYVEGILRLNDGMVLIHNLDRFLSIEEENQLGKVLKRVEKKGKSE